MTAPPPPVSPKKQPWATWAARMSMEQKRQMATVLLLAVLIGLVLLTAGPALWLTAIGQGHLINTPGPEDNEGGMMLGTVGAADNSHQHEMPERDSHAFEDNSPTEHAAHGGADEVHDHEDEDSRPVGTDVQGSGNEDSEGGGQHASEGDEGVTAQAESVPLPPRKSTKHMAWDDVKVADVKRKQIDSFTKYALTGFRNKATTDARILTQFLLSISPRPDKCAIFDVGANIGKYVEELKQMPIARSCDIHAFEPNPEVFKTMERRVKSLDKVHLNNKGVADEPGSLKFYYQPGKADTGGSFLADHSFNALSDTGRMKVSDVEVITLDDVIENSDKIPRDVVIPLVKIDVEGLEYRVKLGMERALRAGRVQAVYWERKGSLKLEPFSQEVEYMASRGYVVYIMGCSGARKHGCRLTMVRVDGPYFDQVFDPKNHRAPNGGKFMTMNVLGVQRDHPFNDKIVKTMLATGN